VRIGSFVRSGGEETGEDHDLVIVCKDVWQLARERQRFKLEEYQKNIKNRISVKL
jgi:hypothetical protein